MLAITGVSVHDMAVLSNRGIFWITAVLVKSISESTK